MMANNRIHLGNIDANLATADWLKDADDLAASGVDVATFLKANPDLPIAQRKRSVSNKSFGDPGNTQERVEYGEFGPGSGAGSGAEARLTPFGRTNAGNIGDAQVADTQNLYAAENMVRSNNGALTAEQTIPFRDETQAQERADELWAKYSGSPNELDDEKGPVVVFANPDAMGTADAIRSGLIGETEAAGNDARSGTMFTGTEQSGPRSMMITLYPGGNNEMTLDHEMAHAISMYNDTKSEFGIHGADMRSTYLTILSGEGLDRAAAIIRSEGGAPQDAMTKAERTPRASITYRGKTITCY